MLLAPIPANDVERLTSLHKMQLLATPPEEAFERITRVAQYVFGVPTVTISLVDEHRQWFKSKIGIDSDETPREYTFCGHVVYSGELMVIEDASKDQRFADNPLVCSEAHIRFYAGRPLRNQDGYVVGTLCLIDSKPRTISAEELGILDDLGYWVEAVFVSRGLSQSVRDLLADLDIARRESMIDSLLRIWNRGAITDILQREDDHARRHAACYSVLMLDVDHFKQINDRYGHPVGDAVLTEIVRHIRQQLRSYDSLGRYGGEEFMMVLPATSATEAANLAERLRYTIDNLSIDAGGHTIHCTVSIGTATSHDEGPRPTGEKLVEVADQALLRAKTNGRNRVEVAN